MDKTFEQRYHNLEDSHFWFKSRRNYILQLLKSAPRSSKILDIGCSSGNLIQDLKGIGFEAQNLFGIDISEEAISNCKAKGLKNCYHMSGEAIALKGQFDIIIASDCLEHIQNDENALEHWYNLLGQNGKLMVFVPAFNSLWSHHDDLNRHFRRYTKSELLQKLRQHHYTIQNSGYWNFTLCVPVWIARKILTIIRKNRSSKTSSDLYDLGILNTPLLLLLNLENKLLKFLNFPFGISTFAIAQK